LRGPRRLWGQGGLVSIFWFPEFRCGILSRAFYVDGVAWRRGVPAPSVAAIIMATPSFKG
jgi:hypothetical protein